MAKVNQRPWRVPGLRSDEAAIRGSGGDRSGCSSSWCPPLPRDEERATEGWMLRLSESGLVVPHEVRLDLRRHGCPMEDGVDRLAVVFSLVETHDARNDGLRLQRRAVSKLVLAPVFAADDFPVHFFALALLALP